MMVSSAVRRGVVLGWVVGLWALGAGAQQPAADVTGVYSQEGGELAVLQGDNETLVYYGASFQQGRSVGTCECSFVVEQKQAPTRWTLRNPDSEAPWSLRLEPRQVVLETEGTPGCCGAGFSGAATFARASARPPLSCKVKAPRAYFHDSDGANTRRKAFVVAGDTVEAYVSEEQPSFVPARFRGKKSLVGLLQRDQLECAARGGSTASAPVLDVKPLVGTWLNVQRKGRGYVIDEPCGAVTPRFTVSLSGDMELEYGQDGERLKVTAATPGAAGAYTLELTREGGSRETLTWTVLDAKKDIVRLKGGSGFFQRGELFVRESRKGGIPVRSEKCDEFE
jgi:hypothetical protein